MNSKKLEQRIIFSIKKILCRRLLTIILLSLFSIEATAKTEEQGFSVSMVRQTIIQGNIPFVGHWGPVRKAHLIKISIPSSIDDIRVSFVKSGFSTADCGNSSRVVTLRDGESTNPDQIRDIFGVTRVSANTSRINFVACIGSTPARNIPRFVINIRYEKEIDKKKDKKKNKTPPPIITKSFKQVGHARIYSILCKQLNSNKGCGTSFNCPAGYSLINIRAACDLENGRVKPLPNWGVVQVAKASDKVKKGSCRVGDINIRKGLKLVAHTTTSKSYFSLGCKEHDKNGGDCSINAQLRCQKVDPNIEKIIPFDCTVSGSNAGCSKVINCPSKYIASDVRASCNLESPQRKPLPDWGWLEVVQASDKKSRSASNCSVHDTSLKILKKKVSIANTEKLNISCVEHDKNGGDCNVRGELKCIKLILNRQR